MRFPGRTAWGAALPEPMENRALTFRWSAYEASVSPSPAASPEVEASSFGPCSS